jgi:polar amino acid transport system substrate-binding protein
MMFSALAQRLVRSLIGPCACVALVAAAIMACLASPAAQADPIKVASEGTFKPFSYFTADGQLAGFDVELAQAICKAAGLDCQMVTMDFDGMLPALKEKKIDVIASGMSITAKRKKVVAFTDRLRTSGKRFVTCAPDKFPKVAPEDLKADVLGTQADTSSADYLKAFYPGSDIRLYRSMDESFADLSSGRLDLVFAQEATGYAFTVSPAGKGCAFVGERLDDAKYFGEGVGMALRQSDHDLLAALNAGIRKVLADGTYKALNAKYFPFSLY